MYIQTDRSGFKEINRFSSIEEAAAWLIDHDTIQRPWTYKFMPFRDLLKTWGLTHESQIPDFLADEDNPDDDKQALRDLMDIQLQEVAKGNWDAQILYVGGDNMDIVRPEDFQFQVEREFFERRYLLKAVQE